MIAKEREKLDSYEQEYLSIGITKGGECYGAIPVPWHSMANAFNMRGPHIFLSVEDIYDEDILEKLKKFHVNGCYIFDELEDYSFLKAFPNIEDLFIRNGSKLKDLSFLRKMKDWFMLYIEDAQLADLNDLLPKEGESPMLPFRCIAFYNCQIDDISALEKRAFYISELLVWEKPGKYEKKRWEGIWAGTREYYSITDEDK